MFIENQLIAYVVLALLVALVVSFLMTPVVKTFAYKVGAIDVPKDARRMHKVPIPRLGGLAIFIGFMVSILLFVEITPEMRSILLGAVIIVVLGVVDDIYGPAGHAEIRGADRRGPDPCPARRDVIQAFSNPNIFSDNPYWVLGSLSIPVTVLWIVAITNSVNLIDGLDGLANGVSAISATTVLVIALMVGRVPGGHGDGGPGGGLRGLHALQHEPRQDVHGGHRRHLPGLYPGHHVHPGPVQVLRHHLLRGALPDSGPAHL